MVIRGNGLWVGWPGIQLTSEEEPIPESDPSDQTPTAGLKSSQVSQLVISKFNLDLVTIEQQISIAFQIFTIVLLIQYFII